LFFDNGHQHVNGDGSPDLNLDGILGGSIERFDTKMLLDPFEEEFDLPAALIELRDGRRWECEVVGQEDQPFVLGNIEIANTSQFVGVSLAGVKSLQDNDLIGLDPCRLVDRPRIETSESEVAFGSDDKEGQCLMNGTQTGKIEIPSIDDIKSGWFEGQLVQDIDIVNLPMGDNDDGGNASA
jgi:hypothetical protein